MPNEVLIIVTFYVFSTVCRRHRVLLQIILRHWMVIIFQLVADDVLKTFKLNWTFLMDVLE